MKLRNKQGPKPDIKKKIKAKNQSSPSVTTKLLNISKEKVTTKPLNISKEKPTPKRSARISKKNQFEELKIYDFVPESQDSDTKPKAKKIKKLPQHIQKKNKLFWSDKDVRKTVKSIKYQRKEPTQRIPKQIILTPMIEAIFESHTPNDEIRKKSNVIENLPSTSTPARFDLQNISVSLNSLSKTQNTLTEKENITSPFRSNLSNIQSLSKSNTFSNFNAPAISTPVRYDDNNDDDNNNDDNSFDFSSDLNDSSIENHNPNNNELNEAPVKSIFPPNAIRRPLESINIEHDISNCFGFSNESNEISSEPKKLPSKMKLIDKLRKLKHLEVNHPKISKEDKENKINLKNKNIKTRTVLGTKNITNSQNIENIESSQRKHINPLSTITSNLTLSPSKITQLSPIKQKTPVKKYTPPITRSKQSTTANENPPIIRLTHFENDFIEAAKLQKTPVKTYRESKPIKKYIKKMQYELTTPEKEDLEKKRKKKPKKESKELLNFIKEFNSMVEEVEKYDLVIEKS